MSQGFKMCRGSDKEREAPPATRGEDCDDDGEMHSERYLELQQQKWRTVYNRLGWMVVAVSELVVVGLWQRGGQQQQYQRSCADVMGLSRDRRCKLRQASCKHTN